MAPATVPPGQQALARLLAEMHTTLLQWFADRGRSGGEQRELLQQRLLLGLELLWKLEEQVVMPALDGAGPACAAQLAIGAREIELMRDLSQRVARTSASEREVAAAALEGMVRLHCTRSDELLAGTAPGQADWDMLLRETQDLLTRWRGEIAAHGEIEDEDRDPVGLPPR